MSLNWYAIHSHSRKEEFLWNHLVQQGLEAYFPQLHVKPVNPRSRKIVPYFPGYLFVQADLNQTGISIFQWMPYSTGLVSFGGEPSLVPEPLLATIRQRVQEIEAAGADLTDSLKRGEAIQIQNGPFAGYEAIFDTRISGSERVRVLLKMLNQRNLPVELESSQIRRLKNPPKS